MTDKKLAEFVNQSGFPLQIGIANLVNRTRKEHHWQVLHTEHSWRDPEDESSGFIDIVLEDRSRTVVFVIECKRVLDTSWVFLQPGDKIVPRRHAKTWVTYYDAKSLKEFNWVDRALDPATPESEYCVVPGQDSKSKPMLERIAGDLVSATESLAREERGLQEQRGDALRVYFSVIVTTARLKVCVFDPEKVDLRDGTLSESQFEEVPFVRFRKQLSTRVPPIRPVDGDPYIALAKAKEHTVFVVNSEALLAFLRQFEVDL